MKNRLYIVFALTFLIPLIDGSLHSNLQKQVYVLDRIESQTVDSAALEVVSDPLYKRDAPICGDSICSLPNESCVDCTLDCGTCDCPVNVSDWTFQINATSSYQFYILVGVNGSVNVSSLAVEYLGFYEDGQCNQSTHTFLIAIPFNGSLIIGSFDQIARGNVCVVYRICSENCCENGTVILEVNDKPKCAFVVSPHLKYVYGRNSSFDLESYFSTPSTPVSFYDIVLTPLHGSYELLGNILYYESNGSFVANDSLVVEGCNEFGLCVNCTVRIDIYTPVQCSDDYAVVLFPTTTDIPILDNDTNLDLQENFTVSDLNIIPFPNTTGSYVTTSAGVLLYTPNVTYVHQDILAYNVCKQVGLTCDTCNVYLTIHSGISCIMDIYSGFSGEWMELDVLSNDVDLEYPNSSLWILTIDSVTVSVNATATPSNIIMFFSTVIQDESGLTYTVTDPSGYNATCDAVIRITSRPVCGAHNLSVVVNSTNNDFNITQYDSNPSGTTLNTTIGLFLYSNATTQEGVVTTNGQFTTSVTYTPPIGFTGVDSFIYKLCDSRMICTNCTVNITVVNATTQTSGTSATSATSATSSTSATHSTSATSATSSTSDTTSSTSGTTETSQTTDTTEGTSDTNPTDGNATQSTSSSTSSSSTVSHTTATTTHAVEKIQERGSRTLSILVPVIVTVFGIAVFAVSICVLFVKCRDRPAVDSIKRKKKKQQQVSQSMHSSMSNMHYRSKAGYTQIPRSEEEIV